jgi:hypothetical protein
LRLQSGAELKPEEVQEGIPNGFTAQEVAQEVSQDVSELEKSVIEFSKIIEELQAQPQPEVQKKAARLVCTIPGGMAKSCMF